MNLQHEILLRTANTSLKDIALIMGYSHKSAWRASQRIQHVLSDPDLGMDSGHYDFKYSDEEFLKKLCQVLGLEGFWVSEEITRIIGEITEKKNRYIPWLFVDTGFKRKEEPLIVLAFLEQYRRIKLPELAGKPVYEQIRRVQEIVVNHYEDNEGRLWIWGEIRIYLFQYINSGIVKLLPDGTIQDANDIIFRPEAIIEISSKRLNLFSLKQQMQQLYF